jgi:hypothetical protein
MRAVSILSGLAALALVVGSARACDKHAQQAEHKAVAAGQGSGCSKAASTGRVDAVMQGLPHMVYKVGDFESCCPEAARAKAGADGKVQYLVAGKAYDCKAEALTALSAQLEEEAGKMSKLAFAVGEESFCCPMTAGQVAKTKNLAMTYRVAGIDFDSQDKANSAVKLVSAVLASGAADSTTQLAGQPAASGCAKSCAKTAAAAAAADPAKPSCGTTTQVAAAGETKVEAAPAAGNKPCCASGAKLASGESQPAAGTATATAGAAPACCKSAEDKVASVTARIRLMVETAVTAL